ncbi:SusC/RagA family TonB-linked outer membrane protein [Rapidithrix thailandica]|uniref:SusC/RagA family TonB-linked outer membrane protein n=1 Tax=Rapidithrix thailandica TaxID=413964 RepID=A0AAW9SBX4_9BACT
MKQLFTLFIFLTVLVPQMGFSQHITKGTVTDASGEALPGVTVSVKNTHSGTVTDLDGKYSVNAPADAVLIFSYVGYETQEASVSGRSEINVVLQEASKMMDEVVVTAIGIKQQKTKLGYATQEMDTESLRESKTLNPGSALAGQIAGLTVNNPTGIFQEPTFELRGKKPLIVVNGIPVESDFFDISAEDIENINVLKGTSASALYGSRGKDGAILITTKNAEKEGLEVNFTTNHMFSAGFTVFPETQTQYGNGSKGKYEFWDGADGGVSDGDMIWGPKFEPGVKVAQWNSPIRDKVTGEVIEWYGNVAGTIYDDKSRYERVPTEWKRHDNLKDFLKTGMVSTNDLSISYKGEKASYYVSAKYAYQKGRVPNTSVHTGGLNFTSTFDLLKNLKLDASLSYNKVYSPNYPRYGYGPKNHMYTILIWMGDDVNGQDLKNHMYVPGLEGYRQANYNYAWYNNVYFAANELEQQHNRDVYNGQLKLNWQITPKLNLQGRINGRGKKLFEDRATPKSYLNYGDSRNGDYKMWNTSQLNLDADILATYTQDITSNIGMTLNAGASSFFRSYQQEYASSDGLIVPGVYSLYNTQGPVQATNNLNEKTIRSLYGMIEFDLFGALFLNFSARNDWSSTLSTVNNSYFYPSVSVSTLVSEYIKMPDFIDMVKLYGSWAQVSSDLDPYNISATYAKGVTYGTLPSVYYPGTLINPDIKPEQSTSTELGLSTSLAKGKLSFDVTYYNVIDKNQIIKLDVSEASGFPERLVNGNVYETNGVEVMAKWKAIKAENFSWNIGANWSSYVKKITEIYGGADVYENLRVGDRADSYYATVWQKSATGELILDADKSMPIRDPYKQNVGHLLPDWRLGLQNRFKIHDFNVSVDIDGAWGGLMNSLTVEKMWWGGKHPNSVEYRDAEYAAGKPVFVPQGVVVTGGELKRDTDGSIISDTRTYEPNTTAVDWQTWSQNYPYRAVVTEDESEKFANTFDRSYFKLRRVSVGYDLTNIMDLGKIKQLNVTVYGYNLLMWKKMDLLDPDYGNDDNLQDPSSRFVGFSLNAKF